MKGEREIRDTDGERWETEINGIGRESGGREREIYIKWRESERAGVRDIERGRESVCV